MLILVFFAFLSGIVTILSPCILPILPIVLSGSVGGKRKPLGVIVGFILSFSIFTLLLSAIVQLFNIPPDALRIVAIILITLFGLVMVIPPLQVAFELFASRMTNKTNKSKKSSGFIGGVIVGFSLGLVWTPCVGPIMASVISLAITSTVDGGSFIIVLAYSLGTSIPMLAIMLGGRTLIQKFPALSKNTGKVQRVFGVLMITVGLSMVFGLDRRFQSTILDIFPQYGEGLTIFENIDPVKKAIDEREKPAPSMMMMGTSPVSFDEEPKNGKLGDYGMAPPLIAEGPWFNSDGKSFTMDDFKGKVVVLDFWTYSCVNCVRTIPHLKSWYETYEKDGLVILGVHSPEFAFERKESNVSQAMKELGVNWPVVLDNSFAQWQAYKNRYWPAKYFIDAEGIIRYFHFGEGQYDTSEKVIRKLLKEAGTLSSDMAPEKDEAKIESRTAETYLGYFRTENFTSTTELVLNEVFVYKSPEKLTAGQWSLQGQWTFKREYVESLDEGQLELSFEAKNVFLVIESVHGSASLEVLVDGKTSINTIDVEDGFVKIEKSRLYQLVELDKAGKHQLTLRIKGKLRLYAFTFG